MSLDSASWELHQYSRRMCGPMKNPKVETRSRDSNSGPQDCEADALAHSHHKEKKKMLVTKDFLFLSQCFGRKFSSRSLKCVCSIKS